MAAFVARGRIFTERQVGIIRQIAERYASEGRTKISLRVCRALNWKRENGLLKETACREVLTKMARCRLVKLPPSTRGEALWSRGEPQSRFTGDQTPIHELAFEMLRIERISDKNDPNSVIWSQLVTEYHYLGQSRLVGRQIRYIVWIKDRPIACFGWTDSAWAIRARDQWIGWNSKQLAKRRHLIINNARFLILPWVSVPNLASFLIAACATTVVKDWEKKYGHAPVLLETFVDPARFKGVCYRAANWIELGRTSGYAKVGGSHHNSQQPKLLFVRAVARGFRQVLKGARNGG